MALKNKRELMVLVPIKVIVYEDENGNLECGGAAWPDLEYIAKVAEQGTEHPHVAALIGRSK